MDVIGRDPNKLLQWVTDKTCFVPYRGVLRGEVGVLMDRRGNSLDRALLLYALIRSAGHQARLAHAELPADRAQELLERTRSASLCAVPDDTRSRAARARQVLAAASSTHKLEPSVLQHHVDALMREQERVVEEIQKRVGEQTAVIAAAAGPPRASTSGTASAGPMAVRDHWWVQWQSDTVWVDLDPMVQDQPLRGPLIAATETTQPGKPRDLPEDLQHVIDLRIVVERWRPGELREQQVLAHTLRPFELYGAHIVLSHQPLRWPSDLDFEQGGNRAVLFKQTALAQREWLPVLSIGRDQIVKSSFTDAGDVNTSPLAPILGGSAQDLGRSIGGLLGGRNAGQPVERQPQSVSQLSAVWIEYELRSPGDPVRKIRRQLFDLIGPASRSATKIAAPAISEEQRFDRSLHLLGTTEILPLASQLSADFLDHLTASSFLKNREVLLDVLRHGDTLDGPGLRDRVSKLTPLPGRLYNLALARNTWSRVRDRVYLDHPNVLSFHTLPGLNARGEPVVRHGFDIVENGVSVNRGVSNAFAVRLEQGVLDTNAEAVLVSGCGAGSPSPGCAEVDNVAEMFASRHDVNWLVVRGAMDTAWQRADVTADIRVRVEQDLAAGYVVVVPSRPGNPGSDVGLGWWRIQPETGHVLGTGRFGWGQSATENLIVLGGTVAFVCVLTKVASEVADDWNSPGEIRGRQSPWPDVIVCGLAGAVTVWFVPGATLTLGSWIFALLAGVLAGRTTRQ